MAKSKERTETRTKTEGKTKAKTKNPWTDYIEALGKKKWERALLILEGLAGQDRRNPQLYLKKGDLLQRLSRPGDAAEAYLESARLFASGGFFEKAIAVCRIILRTDPSNKKATELSGKLVSELEGLKRPEAKECAAAQAEGFVFPEAAKDPCAPAVFPSLSETENRDILERSAHISFGRGETIISEGETGDSIYYIKSGSAAVSTIMTGKRVQLAALQPGDVFGEFAFLTGRPRAASVTASTGVELLEITRFALQEAIKEHPSILEGLQDFYQKRARDTSKKVISAIKSGE